MILIFMNISFPAIEIFHFHLGIGNWEWLGFGRWELGVDSSPIAQAQLRADREPRRPGTATCECSRTHRRPQWPEWHPASC